MLKLIEFNNFSIEWQKLQGNSDYNLRIMPQFDSDNADHRNFPMNNPTLVYPHSFGMIDTSITDENFSLLVIFEDSIKNAPYNNFPIVIQLRKKLPIYIENENPSEHAEPSQNVDEKINSDYRVIKSVDGNASLAIGSECIDKTVGGTKEVITNNGFLRYGNTTRHTLNVDSLGGVFTETGMMQLIPNVPPFAQINKMPDTSFITKAMKMVAVSTKLTEILSKLSGI